MFGIISTEQTQADDWCVFLEAVITDIPHSSVLLFQHICIHKNTQTLILSCVLLCVCAYVCVVRGTCESSSKEHQSHACIRPTPVACSRVWSVGVLTCSEKHCIPCLVVLRRISRTQKKDREKENHADTDSSNPPTRLGRTQQSGGSEARNSLLSSANLYMIEKKKGKKELCVASQLHRFRWWLAVHVSKFSTIFLLFNWATSCNYFLFDLIYCM